MSSQLSDDELVYRSVPKGRGWLRADENGDCQPTSAAFSDRELKISVDRAAMTDPELCQLDACDGVLVLRVEDIHKIEPIRDRIAIVHADPNKENKAHALIVLSPNCDKPTFRKLGQSLKMLARWAVPPSCECN